MRHRAQAVRPPSSISCRTGRREGGLDALVDLGCAGDFHTAAGDLVTQLPQEAGWYWQWTEQIDREDATFGGVTCTTS